MIFPLSLALGASAVSVLAQYDAAPEIREQFGDGLEAELQVALAREAAEPEPLPNKAVNNLFGNNNNDVYQPYKVDCPTGTTFLRSAQSGISDNEKQFLQKRSDKMDNAVKAMMQANNMQTPPRQPKIGVALSGGGYRAMINGMGMVQGLMGDVDEAKNAGTGGWLDAMSYMAGLSGGSWATTTFIANGGQHPSDLAKNVWNLKSNLIFPQDGKVSFYTDLLSEVKAKGKNFPTQITDYWGLALGNHLLPEQYHLSNNPNLTWSQFYSNSSQLQNGELPFPIIIAAERENGTTAVMENATIWEFNPFEFGSWAIGEATNKSWGFFTPIEYMGSNLTDGKPTECWKGYDQMTFVAGTSATLFNQGIIRLNNLDEGKNDSIILNGIRSILDSVSKDQNDISQIPNPGHGYNGDGNPLTELDYLTLIDAGETNQNIPLDPLLLRGADAIIAMDNSADTTYSWPNGSALWTTYQRSLEFVKYNNVPLIMPKVPTTNGFVNEGLNTRPTFFGCDEQDKTIIIYIPNYPWSYGSNSSTYKLEYSDEEVTPQLESAMRAMTLNGTVKDFPKCLACALTDRAFGYDKNNRTQECQQCFNTWCWNGQANDDPPPQNYTALPGVTPQWLVNNNLTTDPKGKDQAITTADKKKNAADTVGASKYVLVGAAITAITALF